MLVGSAFCVLVVVVGYVVAVTGSSRPDAELQAAMLDLVDERAAGGSGRIAERTDFAWDAVGIFGPYQTRDDVLVAMGAPVPRGVTNWLQHETSCLIVFRHEGEVVAWTVLSRDLVACGGLGPVVASPADARLSRPVDAA